MATQESFKRRVRERMARTGERYTTARRALLARAAEAEPRGARVRVSEPEVDDDAIERATGHRWDHWCDLIDSWSIEPWDHAAAARRIDDEHDFGGWWSQGVVVGYERITGRRLPNQMADGTFTANKSRTVRADADELRRLLLDAEHRADLFPGEPTELRSKPSSKAIRLALADGTAMISLEARAGGRTKVVVQHERLPDRDSLERWRFWWAEWLEAIDGDAEPPTPVAGSEPER